MRPSGQKRGEEKEPTTEMEKESNALNGSSAPSPEDEESLAEEIIVEAQLVSTRVLQGETDRFVKLNKMDQALWPCVGRRITKDLETGEVLADEDVVGMSEDELRRPLDKQRKLRVEFYSSTSSSWADLLDEDASERFLLDPVDEQRNLVETLISRGADQGVTVDIRNSR